MIHTISDMDDVEDLGKPSGIIEWMYDLKRQGIAKSIGFSGHRSGKALAELARRHEFDSMLVAANHQPTGGPDAKREDLALPAAADNNMGVMMMKVIRPKETVKGMDPRELIRYALSLPEATGAVIGLDSKKVVDANVDTLMKFKPMTALEREQMEIALNPFFNDKELEWMKPSYTDGHWA